MGAARVRRLVRDPEHADPRGGGGRHRAAVALLGLAVRRTAEARPPGCQTWVRSSIGAPRVVRDGHRWRRRFARRGDLAERRAVRGRHLALYRRRCTWAPLADQTPFTSRPSAASCSWTTRCSRTGRASTPPAREDRDLVVRRWRLVAPAVRRRFREPARRPAARAPGLRRARGPGVRRGRDGHRHRVRRANRMDLYRRRCLDARQCVGRHRHGGPRSDARRLPRAHPERPDQLMDVARTA